VTKKKIFDKKDITVITTHINADYDAIASMLAAHKLYEDSCVIFPGSEEKSLKGFFVHSMAYMFNMADINTLDMSKIKRLVLVDTKRADRIGRLSELIGRDDVEIHIYDHHPKKADDIRGDYEVIRLTGSAVTIISEIIKDRQIDISPDEATVMCLGIYEDTGSFTFSSTTEQDFLAAAFFVSKGANLNIISSLIDREINPQQVSLLNEMIQSATRHDIKGVEVVISSITTGEYVPDISLLVSKMVKMENINTIFVLARMENKIFIIARSRMPDVNAGEILSCFGGGGHSYAASATIKEKTLAQTEQKLLEILYSHIIRPGRLAKDIMSSPPITTSPEILCKDAGSLLTRYNVNALLVVEDNIKEEKKIAGYISRQVIEKAVYHGLEKLPVREYMTTEWSVVKPDADIIEIQKKIIENKQRILPVIDKGLIAGVITRTDLLNVLVQKSGEISGRGYDAEDMPFNVRMKNINNFMTERLSGTLLDILRSIGKVADETGCNAYVIGGFVRDLFMYRSNEDMDIVIEGDGIAFARKFAKINKARVHCHEKFGTAVILYSNGFKIDVASARMEYYKFPAAMPVVEMSSIKLDLYRRDFTINTLAIILNPGRFGRLIDFFSAQKDIKDKAVRVLHNLSFVEDPTRVFRAIRFEQRFGFTIGKLTSGLIENAVKMDFFKRLSGKRVFSELRQIFMEENPVNSIIRLNDYNLLKIIHPSIKLDSLMISLLNSVRKVLSWYDLLFIEEAYHRWAVFFMVFTSGCDKQISDTICSNLKIPSKFVKNFCENRFKADGTLCWFERNMPLKNSIIYHNLKGFRTELILYMMAVTKNREVKRAMSFYFTQLRNAKTIIRGKDLKEMGFEPGPVFSKILNLVLDARLNGIVKTVNDEIKFAKDML